MGVVQTVDLCCNQITRSGALAIARGLAKAKAGGAGAPLELLALDENGISEAGIEQLQQLLKVCVPHQPGQHMAALLFDLMTPRGLRAGQPSDD